MLAAMPRQISLTIAVDIEPMHHPPTSNGLFPDGGANGLSLPRDVAGKSHIQGKQPCHHGTMGRMRSIASFAA
jgi:hypothetical protein